METQGAFPAELFIHRYVNPFGDTEYDVIEPNEMAAALEDGATVGMYRLADTYTVRVKVTLEDQQPVDDGVVPF